MIQVQNGSGSNQSTIGSAITIMGNGGSATIRNDSTGTTAGLQVTDGIAGNSTAGNTTTLYLDGVSTASITVGIGRNNLINGVLSDGINGGKLKVVKNGTGVWMFNTSVASTFTGGFEVNAGTIRFYSSGNRGFGAGTVTIGNGVTFIHANAAAVTITNQMVVNGNFTLSGVSNDTWSGTMDLGGATRTITSPANAHELSGVISNGGLTKAGNGTLILSGSNTYSGNTVVSAGTLTLSGNKSGGGNILVGGLASTLAVMNIQGGSVSSAILRAGNLASSTGIIYQTAGSVSVGGTGASVQVGSGGSSYGEYHFYGGTLNAGYNLYIGVNSRSTGVFDMTNGQMAAVNLLLGRNGTPATNVAAYYYQSGGTATVNNLYVGGSGAAPTNTYGYFAVSNGTFTATNFTALVGSPSSTGHVYFGQGSLVTLGAFPTVRGTGSYADLTFDGGTLSPVATSLNYMSNLNSAVITTNGAIFTVASGKSITVAQVLEDAAGQAGTLTKQGVGFLTLSGANSYSGGTRLEGGKLILQNGTGNSLPGDITITNGSLRLGAADQIADAAIVAFATNANEARLELQGFNETIGGVQDAGGSGNRIVEAAADFTTNKPATLTVNVTGAGAYSFDGYVRDAPSATGSVLSITKDGTGTQTFSGAPDFVNYSGATIINAGVHEFSGAGSVADLSAITINGGNVMFSGGGTRSNIIAGAGGLIKAGTNTLTLSGANTYSGGTTNSAGRLDLGHSEALGTGRLVMNGGVLGVTMDLNAGNGVTNAVVLLSNGTITNVHDLQLSGVISGSGALTKDGSGMLTLSGNNSYSGGTVISGGTLALNDGATMGSDNVSVGAGALLSFSSYALNEGQALTNRGTMGGNLSINSGALVTGGGSFSGSVTNRTGGTLTPGTGGDTNYFNNLTLEAGSTNRFYVGSTSTHDMSVVTNSLAHNGDHPLLQLDLSE